jgi:pimeloyl-ACP methyl ester carboxylesterase
MRKLIALSLLLGLALSPPAGSATVPPIDPLTYTVVRTPPALQVEFPPLDRDSSVVIDQVKPFPDRRVPPVFWFEGEGLRFGLVRQDRPAPLVFLIAGTGASFDSDTNRLLARALHRAGMHVLGLPSPTHPNFIVNASATGVPGRMEDDARDLYRAMRLAYDRIKDRIEVTDFRLTGYSLGATNAAWVARHDEGEQAFRFRKVLLLNPSVSLFNSVQILDGMYDRYVGDDPEAAQRIIDRVFAAFADVYTREQGTNFDGEFLYHAYQQMRPGPEALEMLIGTSFRFSAANMAFASDAMSRGGYMLARDAELDGAVSLTNIFKHATRHSFNDYIDGLFLPYFQARDPSYTKERAIADAGLHPIETYLRSTQKITLITNQDDIILAPTELAWLRQVFQDRAVIFADGGHCGNYQRADVLAAISRLLAE